MQKRTIANKIAGLIGIVGAFTVLMWLMLSPPAEATPATQPPPFVITPTVTTPTSNTLLCRLSLGQNCELTEPLEDALNAAWPRYNPAVNATNVPTYTKVAVSFNHPLNPATLTHTTFYLSQGQNRVSGTISYIDTSRLAVFSPAQPLLPGTPYTATLTPGVLDIWGQSLPQTVQWSFSTLPDPQSGELSTAASVGGMNVYFGDLHSHTGYSDGKETPAKAFETAEAMGLDFFAVTDHGFLLNNTEWQDLKNQADNFTINSQFVALPGFEYSNNRGHLNVINSNDHIGYRDPAYDTFDEFYNWLVDQPDAVAQFNHPNSDNNDFNFNNFQFNPEADLKIVLQELISADQFFLGMNKGWHLGSLKNSDTHQADWGCCPAMGLVAPSLTKDSILDALENRRTFFVSGSDNGSNFAIVMRANGTWMGSAVPNTSSLNFNINIFDPNPPNKTLRIAIYENGNKIADTSRSKATQYTWNRTVSAKLGRYYYVEAYYDGWLAPSYSSPVWVERPPTARLTAWPQLAAPGMAVTLNGSQSTDPDGDALAYNWVQTSGPAGSLTPNKSQATFIAPNAAGTVDFKLTVVDTGSLSDVDTAQITITTQPYLTLVKSGPKTTNPGELITYILTATNIGATPATNVVITDAIPAGATHVSGGTLMPGNIVSWSVPNLAAGGETVQVSFTVSATGGIANTDYRASCQNCVPAKGSVSIVTNGTQTYLPVIIKGY